MSMKAKAFVCLHGFGNHSGGHRPGFSAALRRAVEARLGAKTVWKEVLWDDLLGSPSSMTPASFVLEAPALVRAFYKGEKGKAARTAAKTQTAVVRLLFSFSRYQPSQIK